MGIRMLKIKKRENQIVCFIKKLQRNPSEVVLYGAGYCGHEALEALRENKIKVAAVCDDYRIGEKLDGEQITDIQNLMPKENTVILITSGFNEKMKLKLETLHLTKYYQEIDFGRYDKEKESFEWFEKHKAELDKAYQMLEDDASKCWMEELVNYKISRDITTFLGNRYYDCSQYFPKENKLDLRRTDHVFLDLGAFDGDTCLKFLEYCEGKYEKVIAVEASRNNYEKLCTNLKTLQNVELHNVGVYKEKTTLKFEMNDAKNAFVSEQGQSWIDVESVDDILSGQKVTFIKMDIEGAEYDAILGAKQTIRKHTPILAVSVYHFTEDIFRIQLLIEKIHPHYKYYLRHYSPTAIETVLYAVPKEEN